MSDRKNPAGVIVGPNELTPPEDVVGNAAAHEVLRCWIDGGQLLVSLNTGLGPPADWGMLLADVARHVSNGYEQDGSHTYKAARALIWESLVECWPEDMDDDKLTTWETRKQ